MGGIAVAGEVVTAGTALAGLILIYIGSLVTSFGGYAATEQKSVRARFQARAWLAFVGFVFALGASALAILGKWIGSVCVANVAVWVLFFGFGWAVLATVQGIREIK
ncbi:MAG: hypothetical protein U1E59_03660 [Amaricoccus sp.]